MDGTLRTTGKQLGGATGKGFMPGRSGNPGGRAKLSEAARLAKEAAAKLAPQVINRLAEIALSKRTRSADAVTAGNALLRAAGVFDEALQIQLVVTTRAQDVYPDGRRVVRESVRTAASPSVH